MTEQVDTFLAITGSNDGQVAQNFLEMSGGDLDTAISLFFEHGPSVGQSNNNTSSGADLGHNSDDDAVMAQRLQNEAYQQQTEEPRAPMEARHERLVDDLGVFPGTFGGIGGGFNPLLRQRRDPNELIFGQGRRGIFNQRDEDEFNVHSDHTMDSDDEEEDDTSGMTETQKRLARMFRPPFDLIEKLDLDTAKQKARTLKKWILINIQDAGDFRCQVLNRDFWSSSTIKEVVRENFIFLQYAKDSRSGEQYSNFYPFDDFPHIAILDPITGERIKVWSKMPNISQWSNEVYDFLNEFSLDPKKINPIVKHEPKIDLNSLSEEKQLEYAINQSLDKNKSKQNEDEDSDLEIMNNGDEEDPIEIDDEEETQPKELSEEEIVKQIKPLDYPEPESSDTTRIQIRLGDGSRIIKKFDINDTVLKIYQFIKHEFQEKLKENHFILTSSRENLIKKLNDSINDAGLKNASILMEIVEND